MVHMRNQLITYNLTNLTYLFIIAVYFVSFDTICEHTLRLKFLKFFVQFSDPFLYLYRTSMGHFECNRACNSNSNSNSKPLFLRFTIHYSPSQRFMSIYSKKQIRARARNNFWVFLYFNVILYFMVRYECSFRFYLVFDVLYIVIFRSHNRMAQHENGPLQICEATAEHISKTRVRKRQKFYNQRLLTIF